MIKLLSAATLLFLSLTAFAQSVDEKLGSAMNSSDFFGLYDTYNNTDKATINPFLEVFSRCMIGNRFNRPDISIPAFDELLKTQSENLDLNLLLQCSAMYSMDLSRVGKNDMAHDLLSSVLSAAYQMVDSVSLKPYADMAARYQALTPYSPYQITINGSEGIIPFDTIPVGKPDSGQYLMQINGQINGNNAKITFDTGAGANVITDSLASVYGLELLDAKASVTGIDSSVGHYAIAKELKLGNIKITDVPFYVIDISSHNEEADNYLGILEVIIGSELMLQLKDVTLDFTSKEIVNPKIATEPANVRPNMCFSAGMNLLANAEINGEPILIILDSGDASYGSLTKSFFEQNKEMLTSECKSDTIRHGGVGGVWEVPCYRLPDAILSLAGNKVKIPSIPVMIEGQNNIRYNNLGIRSMMLYSKLRFNLVDMVITTEL